MAESTLLPDRPSSGVRSWLRIPRTLLRPSTLCLAALTGLVAAELSVRSLDASRGYSAHARAAWYWLFEQDPFLGYRGRPNASASIPGEAIRHNADGFRDDRTLEKLGRLKDRRLVVCVGDANTYGLTAGTNDLTYPAALERELRALSKDDRWVVFNAGIPGYTTHEILELVKLRLLKAQPAVLVLMSLVNDHEHVTMYLDDALDYDYYPLRMAPWPATRLHDLLMSSVLIGRAAERWRPRMGDDLGGRHPMRAYGEATPRGTKLYLDNVALLAELCARSKVALMFVDQPIHYSFCSYSHFKIASVERMRRGLRDTCAGKGVTLLEAHRTFDWEGLSPGGDLLLASDEYLLGRRGYERLARLLAPQILAAYLGPR